jgi:hypothetical protein
MWQYKCSSEFSWNCVMLHLTKMASYLNFDAMSVNIYIIGMYIKIIDVHLWVVQAPLVYMKTVICHSYSKTNEMHVFLKLFILVKHSTCFGRSFRPSTGAQDCSYSNRQMSDGRKERPKHVVCFTRINNLRNTCISLVLL